MRLSRRSQGSRHPMKCEWTWHDWNASILPAAQTSVTAARWSASGLADTEAHRFMALSPRRMFWLSRHTLLHAYRCGGDPRAEGKAPQIVSRKRSGGEAGGRAHHRQVDSCARQQRGNRWSEACGYQWLVCGSTLRHGEHLQNLCGGEPQRPIASGHNCE
jgi:hypothetical protein